MKTFYSPTQEHLSRLSEPWQCSFSGGKDSTSMVTWIEWLRRSGLINVPQPKLVRSDTGVEDVGLAACAEEMMSLLTVSGWECVTVRPDVHERLYPQILGRGLPPIHPGIKRLRWCTRSTKIDPMRRAGCGELSLTGLRLGESAMRDGKLLKSSCAAGGECGIPDPGQGRYSPILHWKTCQVIDWLNGLVDSAVRAVMGDVFAATQRLVEVYGFHVKQPTFAEFGEPEIVAARFGCIGCPAIQAESHAPRSVVRRYGIESPLCELYAVWYDARLPSNRLVNRKNGKPGPLRMDARKRLFDRVVGIQERTGIVLITAEDEEFIRLCWTDNVYPRGWPLVDEARQHSIGPLFDRTN